MNLAIPMNFTFTVLSALIYHKSQNKWNKILFGILTAFFINGLIAFIFEEYFIETEYYLKQYLFTALLILFVSIKITPAIGSKMPIKDKNIKKLAARLGCQPFPTREFIHFFIKT